MARDQKQVDIVHDGDTVRLCPNCQAKVTRQDDRAGRCPGCGRLLVCLAWQLKGGGGIESSQKKR